MLHPNGAIPKCRPTSIPGKNLLDNRFDPALDVVADVAEPDGSALEGSVDDLWTSMVLEMLAHANSPT